MLQISTRTTPATSAPAIFSSVTLTGGATSRPLARVAPRASTCMAPNSRDDHEHHDPARGRRQVAARDVVDDLVVDRDEPPWPSISSITPCQPSRPASVTTNDGRPSRVMIVPCSTPIAAQTTSATADRRPPRPVRTTRLTSSAVIDAADARDEADRQVDLAEQQGEDLAHRQQHVRRALDQQVDEVAGGQEVRVERLEQDRDQQQTGDDRQHAALAAADPRDSGADVVAAASRR